MQKLQKNIFTIAIVIILAIGGFLFISSLQTQNKGNNDTSVEQSVEETITLTVRDGAKVNDYKVTEVVGKTALEATEKAVTIKKTGEGANAFITSINGRAAEDSKKEFWKLIINGEDAQVGAGSYTLKESDSIIWEIDTY